MTPTISTVLWILYLRSMSGRQHGREEGRLDCWQLPFLGVNMDEGRVRGKAAAQKGQDRQIRWTFLQW